MANIKKGPLALNLQIIKISMIVSYEKPLGDLKQPKMARLFFGCRDG